jgi:hypothetical protein
MDSFPGKQDQVAQGNAVFLRGLLDINTAAGSSELAPEAVLPVDHAMKRLNEVLDKQKYATTSLTEAIARFRGVVGRLGPSSVVCVVDRFSGRRVIETLFTSSSEGNTHARDPLSKLKA